MPVIVHSTVGIVLIIAHGFFLFRGLAMKRNGGAPGTMDRIARFISHFGIPAALLAGFLAEKTDGAAAPLHIVLGILPVITIIVFTPFLALRRKISWLLPSLNLLFLTLAGLSGFLDI